MRFAYADPPYVGQARRHYGCTEINHAMLISHLVSDFPDGWALSCSSTSLRELLPLCPEDARVAAWVKPFASFKPGVNPAYAWEPVIFLGGGAQEGSGRPDCTRLPVGQYHVAARNPRGEAEGVLLVGVLAARDASRRRAGGSLSWVRCGDERVEGMANAAGGVPMTCRDCERMREALVEIMRLAVAMPVDPRVSELAMQIHRLASAALAPASEPPADVVERATAAAVDHARRRPMSELSEAERDEWRATIRAALAAIGDPSDEVRAVLREVLDHAEVSIHVEKSHGVPTGVGSLTIRVRDKLPADLLKRAEEVCK